MSSSGPQRLAAAGIAGTWSTVYQSSDDFTVVAQSSNGSRVLVLKSVGYWLIDVVKGTSTRVDTTFDGTPLTDPIYSGTLSADGSTVAFLLTAVDTASQPRLRVAKLDGSSNVEYTLPDPGVLNWSSGPETCMNQTRLGLIHLTDNGSIAWVQTAPCFERRILSMDVSTPSLRWSYHDRVVDGDGEITGDGAHWVVSWDFCIDDNSNNVCDPPEEKHSAFYAWTLTFDNNDAHAGAYFLDWPGCFWSWVFCGVNLPTGLRVRSDSAGRRFLVSHPDVGLDASTVTYDGAASQMYLWDEDDRHLHYLGGSSNGDPTTFRIAGDGRSVLYSEANGVRRMELENREVTDFVDVSPGQSDPLLVTAARTTSSYDGSGTLTGVALQTLALTQAPHSLRVAVLGDSYISGEGIGTYEAGTDVHSSDPAVANLCHRSAGSWAVRLGARLAAYDSTQLLFRACSGARTYEVVSGQYNETGAHTQLAELKSFAAKAPVDVVFLSAGGNDAGFKDIIVSCAISSCLTTSWKQARLQAVQHAAVSVEGILTLVRNAAPGATIVLSGYPSIVDPATGDCPALGLTSVQSAALAAVPGASTLVTESGRLRIDRTEQAWLNDVLIPAFNADLSRAATESGVRFVDPRAWFQDHPVCSTDPYGNGLRAGDDAPAFAPILGNESFHPNIGGHAAFAHHVELAVFDALRAGANPPAVPAGLTDPGAPNEVGVLVVAGQVHAWGDSGKFAVQGAPDGTVVVTGLYSSPLRLGKATTVGGTATIPFTIPSGIPPGLHTLVFYDDTSGAVLASEPVVIDMPASCYVSGADVDIDADGVADRCDINLADGPAADSDADGVLNGSDDCPTMSDPDQADANGNGIGDACDPDLGFEPVTQLADPPTTQPQPLQVSVVSSVTGAGGIVSAGDSPDWSCSSGTCTRYANFGDDVTFTATPDPGSTFDGWTGACTGAGPCVLTADQPRSVQATFGNAAPEVTDVRLSGTGPRATGAVQFSEDVTGASAANVRLVDSVGSAVPTSIACRASSGASVDCGGYLRSLTVTPTVDLRPGAGYRLEVGTEAGQQIVDRSGVNVPGVAGSWVRPYLVVDDASLGSGWGRQSVRAAIGGSVRTQTRRGASFSATFTGSSVRIWYVAGPMQGRAQVSVDNGRKVVGLDQYAASVTRRYLDMKGLASGNHRLTVTVLAARRAASHGVAINVDSFTSIRATCLRAGACPSEARGLYKWARLAQPSRFAGGVSVTATPGSQLTTRFYGSGINILRSVGPHAGSLRVLLDGRVVGTAVGYSRATGLATWRSPSIVLGWHSVQVIAVPGRLSGDTEVALDYLQIR